MTIVLAAIEADACAQPVLSTAIALADLFDATAVALHVREDGTGEPRGTCAAPPGSSCARRRATRSSRSSEPRKTPTSPRSSSARAACTEARSRPDTPRSRSSRARASRSRSSHPTRAHRERLSRILLPLEGTQRELTGARGDGRGSRTDTSSRSLCCMSTRQRPCPRSPITSPTQRALGSRSSSLATSRPRTNASGCVRRLGVPADDVVAVARETERRPDRARLEPAARPRPRTRGIGDARAQRDSRAAPTRPFRAPTQPAASLSVDRRR